MINLWSSALIMRRKCLPSTGNTVRAEPADADCNCEFCPAEPMPDYATDYPHIDFSDLDDVASAEDEATAKEHRVSAYEAIVESDQLPFQRSLRAWRTPQSTARAWHSIWVALAGEWAHR